MRIKVILNPKSNKGSYKDFETIIRKKFNSSLIEFDVTTHPGNATEIAKNLNQNKIDTVVVVGGDGTVNEVINGLQSKNIPIGIIPTGTANDLASYCKIPLDIGNACDVILKNNQQTIDLINVNGRYYVTGGGIGLPAKVAKNANWIKNKGALGKIISKILGSNLYILALLFSLFRKYFYKNTIKIIKDGSLRKIDTVFLTVNNQPYIGKNFLLSPFASNKDGIMDVCCAIDTKNIFKILIMLFKTLTGKHINSSLIETYRAQDLKIIAENPIPFFGDGETFFTEHLYKIKIVPKAITVFGLYQRN